MRRHPWLTAAAVSFVLCAVVFFCFEWTAEKRWQRYADEARARGVKLMLADFAQPAIPDEENFAALPMLRKAFSESRDDHAFAMPQVTLDGTRRPISRVPWENWPPFANPAEQKPVDWAQWRKAFLAWGYLSDPTDQPAADVLRGLEHYAPEFEEWRQWRVRPHCRFPLDLTKGVELPWTCIHLFRQATLVFALRMRAHLAVGDSAAAYGDFQDGLQVYRALREQPGLVPGAIRVMMLARLVNVVGDGLKTHEWAAAECRKIEADLGQIRIWDDWAFTLSTARASGNAWLQDWMKKSLRERDEEYGSHSPGAERYLTSLVPRAWIRDTQVLQNRYFDELLARVDLAHQTIDPSLKTPSSPATLSGTLDQYHYLFYYPQRGQFEGLQQSAVTVAKLLDQTRLICALEQFRARHQAYPETLDELTPEFIATIPNEILSNGPYRYKRVGATRFRLYGSVFDHADGDDAAAADGQ